MNREYHILVPRQEIFPRRLSPRIQLAKKVNNRDKKKAELLFLISGEDNSLHVRGIGYHTGGSERLQSLDQTMIFW